MDKIIAVIAVAIVVGLVWFLHHKGKKADTVTPTVPGPLQGPAGGGDRPGKEKL